MIYISLTQAVDTPLKFTMKTETLKFTAAEVFSVVTRGQP